MHTIVVTLGRVHYYSPLIAALQQDAENVNKISNAKLLLCHKIPSMIRQNVAARSIIYRCYMPDTSYMAVPSKPLCNVNCYLVKATARIVPYMLHTSIVTDICHMLRHVLQFHLVGCAEFAVLDPLCFKDNAIVETVTATTALNG